MTSIRFLLALSLAFSVAACGDALSPGAGTGGTGGTGTGGTGGTPDNDGGDEAACTNDSDTMALENYTFEELTGGDAVTAFAQGCVISSCFTEVVAVIGEESTQEDVDALGACVGSCVGDEIGFTEACENCYGSITACGSANCATECGCLITGCTDEAQFACNACINDNCVTDFLDCSGLDGTLPTE